MALIQASAPGRCGLLGNPSDMYGGSVLSCSLAERATCTLSDAETLTLAADGSLDQEIHEAEALVPDPDFPLLDLSKAVLRGMGVDPQVHRFRITTSTEIPMQAGLAGSTALIAAVYGASPDFLAESRIPMSSRRTFGGSNTIFLGSSAAFKTSTWRSLAG